MIIYGSRMYFKKNLVNSFGRCQYCGSYSKQRSYQAIKFGHIYFIPLIPLGSKSQVLNECRSCDMGAHIKMQDLDPMVDSLAERFKDWIIEIQDGNHEIEAGENGEKINGGELIAGILEELYCLKEIENVDSITTILDSNNMGYEKAMVMGRWHEIQGKLDEAKQEYESAHRIAPDRTLPLYQLGLAAVNSNDQVTAESAFSRYTKLEPEDASPWIELAGMYEGKKDWPNIIRTYDEIYTLAPDVIPDKGMKKLYKKACKKSGQQGKFLAQM